ISGLLLGAPRWRPNPPHRSDRPGDAVAPLYLPGGPEMAPNPTSFGPPRRSRGAPLFQAYCWGPTWPDPPAFGPPRRSRGGPLFQACCWGPDVAPIPHRSGRRGGAGAVLYFRRISGGAQ